MPSAGNGKGGSGGNMGGAGSGGGQGKSSSSSSKNDSKSTSSSKGSSTSSKGSSSSGIGGGSKNGGGNGNGGRDSYSSKDGGLGSTRDAANASNRSANRDRMEQTKDRDMNPNGPAVSKQKDKYEGNARTIAETLADKGWNDHQIAGALGRLQQESSLNPNATRKNDNMKAAPGLRDSVGIGQWNGTRQQALKDYASARGKNWNDLATQTSFLDHEMRNSKDEKAAWSAMQKATNVAEAATAMMHYERPQGYSRTNPSLGHGYQNTLNYASAFAAGRGLKTDLGANADPQAVASTSTAHQTLGKGVASANAYVDPMVSTPNSKKADPVNQGISAIGSLLTGAVNEIAPDLSKDPRSRERQGLGKLGKQLDEKDGLGALKTGLGAIADPVGFALSTIEDAWNQNGGLKGLQEDIAGLGLKDFSIGSGSGGGVGGITGSRGDSMASPTIGTDTFGILGTADAAVAAVTPATQVPRVRRPFEWSTLSGDRKFV